MVKTDLRSVAASLPIPWRSTVLGEAGGANLKIVRMDHSAYAEEIHPYAEALLVIEGQMNLKMQGRIINVAAGEIVIVPAHEPHAVAPGSSGTLLIIDAPE